MMLREHLKYFTICVCLVMWGAVYGQCPQFSVTAPGTFTGNTCGASNSCGNFQIDHVFEVDIPSSGNWTFSTCGSSYDTWLFLYGGSCCGTSIANNDDFCGYQSEFTETLVAGTYYVVIDGSILSPYCGDYSLSVNTSSALGLSIASNDVDCNGNCSGSATVTPSAGMPPYSYMWDPSSQTTQTATGLCAGIHQVLVTDSTGTTDSVSVSISDPAPLLVAIDIISPSGSCNGSATANPTGGTLPYSYQWNAAANNQTTQTADSLCAGTYCVTVTDLNNCTVDTCSFIPVGIFEVTELDDLVKIYPNPSKGEFILELAKPLGGPVELQLFDPSGRMVRSIGYIPAGVTLVNVDVGKLTNGIYQLWVTDQDGTISKKIIVE